MSTKLNQVVQSMSEISVPESFLRKVDVNKLLKDFSTDYKKLDNLKSARARHEGKNAFMRWLDSDELGNAQLDAVELQADFSKKLGQLMAISIAQSQQLSQQQKSLSQQQGEIKEHTEKLDENSRTLRDQHSKLQKQNIELENLVKNYFELKGLTRDGAVKLIEIAHEVQEAKDEILKEVGYRLHAMEKMSQSLLAEYERLTNSQDQQINEFKRELSQSLSETQALVEQRTKQTLQQVNQTDEQLQHLLIAIEQQAKQHDVNEQSWQLDKNRVLSLLSQQDQDVNDFKSEFSQSLNEIQDLVEQKAKQVFQQVHQKDDQLQQSLDAVKQQITEKQSEIIGSQNNKLEKLQAEHVRLQQKYNEQELQNEKHHQLFERVDAEFDRRESSWGKRLKIMTYTTFGSLLLSSSAVGYLFYTRLY